METLVTAESDYELERGKPTPSLNHAIVQTNLAIQLVVQYGTLYRIASELSLELITGRSTPDLVLYDQRPVDFRNDEIRVTEPPLGTIEIISPTQAFDDLIEKAKNYFAAGVKSCWVVLPSLRNIYVFSDPDTYQIFRHDEVLTDEKLGITLPLEPIFK
jgi:Uma2 family endonuclease